MNLPASPVRAFDELCRQLSRDAFEMACLPHPTGPFLFSRIPVDDWRPEGVADYADRIIAIRTQEAGV